MTYSLGGLLFVLLTTGCGFTTSTIVDPTTGESKTVRQGSSLCTVELEFDNAYLIDKHTESCFLGMSGVRGASFLPVDCTKLMRNYAPAAKCITWLPAEGSAASAPVTSTPVKTPAAPTLPQ